MEQMIENRSLDTQNSFGIKVRTHRYFEFCGVEQLRLFFTQHHQSGEPWYLLSGGNNVLFTQDYPGTILHPVSRGMEQLSSDDPKVVRVQVAGGEEWDDFVAWSVAHGWGGVENLSLIPGYVGAAPVQNIGAYGVELKETVEAVEVYLVESDQVRWFSAQECRFGYRDSVFKQELKGKAIILSVIFRLHTQPELHLRYGDLKNRVEEGGCFTLDAVRKAVISIRQSKLPDPRQLGNAGSFFKNPVVDAIVADRIQADYPTMPSYPAGEGRVKLAAGWLIDQAGWRGKRKGNVGVHEAQALVLVNYGGATGAEVFDLAREIQRDVRTQFCVEIEMEVNVL